MRRLLVILVAALTCAAAPAAYPEYGATPLQIKVDGSFSAIPIDARFSRIRRQLTIADRKCRPVAICDWRDADGVQYQFEGADPRTRTVIVKRAIAAVFAEKPIWALGIGLARSKTEVLANVRRFAPEIVLDCAPPSRAGDIGIDACAAQIGPGWIEIGFDQDGQLTEARLYGYFT